MNRLKIIFFSLVILLFVGCQGGQREVVIGVSQSVDDDWHKQLSVELLTESGYFEGFSLNITSANGDSSRQIKQIERFINDGVDALVVTPADSLSLVPIIERAFDQNIPVIVVNRRVATDKYTAFVGANNHKLGRIIGANVLRKSTAKSLLELCSSSDRDLSQIRHQGVLSSLNDEIDYLGCYYVSQTDVERVVDSLLAVIPNVDLIVGHTDKIAQAAHNSAVRASRDSGILFWGIGALSTEGGGIDLVNEGTIDATYIYSTGANQILNLIHNIHSNKPFRRETPLSTPMVDSSRARILKYQKRGEVSKLNNRVDSLSGNLSEKTKLSNYRLYMLLVATLVLITSSFIILIIIKLLKHKTDAARELERQYRELEKALKKMDKIEESTAPLENKFLTKFYQIIEQNISNVDFEFENIGDELCYSRVQVYRKVKALTGESPSKLLRKARLERAKELLQTTDKPIADIAFEVGFSAPSYFTKSYKDHFGELPSAVKR